MNWLKLVSDFLIEFLKVYLGFNLAKVLILFLEASSSFDLILGCILKVLHDYVSFSIFEDAFEAWFLIEFLVLFSKVCFCHHILYCHILYHQTLGKTFNGKQDRSKYSLVGVSHDLKGFLESANLYKSIQMLIATMF